MDSICGLLAFGMLAHQSPGGGADALVNEHRLNPWLPKRVFNLLVLRFSQWFCQPFALRLEDFCKCKK